MKKLDKNPVDPTLLFKKEDEYLAKFQEVLNSDKTTEEKLQEMRDYEASTEQSLS